MQNVSMQRQNSMAFRGINVDKIAKNTSNAVKKCADLNLGLTTVSGLNGYIAGQTYGLSQLQSALMGLAFAIPIKLIGDKMQVLKARIYLLTKKINPEFFRIKRRYDKTIMPPDVNPLNAFRFKPARMFAKSN